MVEYPPVPAVAVRLASRLRAQDPQRGAGGDAGIGAQIGGIRVRHDRQVLGAGALH